MPNPRVEVRTIYAPVTIVVYSDNHCVATCNWIEYLPGATCMLFAQTLRCNQEGIHLRCKDCRYAEIRTREVEKHKPITEEQP